MNFNELPGWLGPAAAATMVVALAREIVATSRLRTRMRVAGAGLLDDETGARTITAVAIDFPVDLQVARQVQAEVCLSCIRASGGTPKVVGAALVAAVRQGELIYRIDHDVYVTTIVARDRGEAVAALARLGGRARDAGARSVEIGSSSSASDGDDFLSLVDAASLRYAPLERYEGLAARWIKAPASKANEDQDDQGVADR